MYLFVHLRCYMINLYEYNIYKSYFYLYSSNYFKYLIKNMNFNIFKYFKMDINKWHEIRFIFNGYKTLGI